MKRNRRNKKMTLIGFVSHGRVKWTGSIFIFGIGVPTSTSVTLTFLLTLLQRNNSYVDDSNADDFNGEIAATVICYKMLHAICRISRRNFKAVVLMWSLLDVLVSDFR